MRNFFFCAFVIGLIFALFYFAAAILLWDTAVSLATHLFKIDENEFGRLVLLFFIELRVVLVFFFLVPALALHWVARKAKIKPLAAWAVATGSPQDESVRVRTCGRSAQAEPTRS